MYFVVVLGSCCSKRLTMLLPMSFPCRSLVAPVLLPSLPVLVFMSIEFSEYFDMVSILFAV